LKPLNNVLLPHRAELEVPGGGGTKIEEVYMCDLATIGDELLMKIAARIASKTSVHSLVIFDEFKQRGLPLRVSQTNGCSTDSRHFL
jgi:hypothetical protein